MQKNKKGNHINQPKSNFSMTSVSVEKYIFIFPRYLSPILHVLYNSAEFYQNQGIISKIRSTTLFHTLVSLITWPKTFFWTGTIFIGVYVSVCVCKRLPQLSQKVLDWFWWNLAGWFIMIKDRFPSKMSLIGLLERKLQKIRHLTFS